MTAVSAPRNPPAWAAGFNRLALRISGHRLFPLYAVVEHVGRKSGRAYEVPVALIASPTQFVICLPFGRGTNWARNVVAAGGCDIRWKGGTHHVTSPRVVGREVALPLANRFERFMIPRLGFSDFLLLDRVEILE
ncbi:MAG TPA: nitroreductase family deazaflavin-dependent oxidoreductase [Lapillicoccus sp.]|nr:nitroreductase family deazaflavin-dependent oxidoreductase [Lapillicoccus sp.]